MTPADRAVRAGGVLEISDGNMRPCSGISVSARRRHEGVDTGAFHSQGGRMRRPALKVSVAFAVVAAVLTAMASPVVAGPAARSAGRRVIVVLKSRYRAVVKSGDRREAQRSAYAANRLAESPVIAVARQHGARNVHGYGLIGAFSATVSTSGPARSRSIRRSRTCSRISGSPWARACGSTSHGPAGLHRQHRPRRLQRRTP